jgi:tRNA (cytidine/uridine-2'-O-)-methyltransferase
MRLVLIEPDIPQNVGAMLRLAGCLGVAIDLIGPFGFVWSDAKLRRAGMDYIDLATVERHESWVSFVANRQTGRLILLTTTGAPFADFTFAADDLLLLGSESSGASPAVHAAAHARLRIPMVEGARSLNVATAASLVLGHALGQTGFWRKHTRASA